MTIEHTDLRTVVSEADLLDLRSLTSAATAGMATVKELHPGYSWVWTDEIRCWGKECNASLYIPPLTSTSAVAGRVFADHQQKDLQRILSARSA